MIDLSNEREINSPYLFFAVRNQEKSDSGLSSKRLRVGYRIIKAIRGSQIRYSTSYITNMIIYLAVARRGSGPSDAKGVSGSEAG